MMRKKKTLSGDKHPMIVSIPPLVRLGIVAIELELRPIGVQVEHVRVAIAVGNLCAKPSISLPV